MLIQEATISIICLIIFVYTAVRYYTGVGRKKDTYEGSIYMLMLVFALAHICADGILRIKVGEPAAMSVKSMSDVYVFIFYMVYICGLVGTVQMAADAVIVNAEAGLSKKVWVLLHLPAAIIVGVSAALIDKLGLPLIRYSSLFVAIVMFIFVAWFYERIESDLRRTLIEVIVGCVLIFVCYFILKITVIPAVTPLMLLVIGFGSLRGGYVETEDETEDETEAELIEESDKVKLSFDPLTGTDINKVAEDKKARRRAEKEAAKAKKAAEKEAAKAEKITEKAEKITEKAERITEKAEETEDNKSETDITKDELGASVTAILDTESVNRALEVEQIQPEPPAPKAPPEPIKVADEDLASLRKMEQTVAVEMRVQPLIMEKDLKENYHKLGECAAAGDQAGCEKIIEHLSGFRISGIHVTRFGRIKNAVANGDLDTVKKEVESF